MSSGTRNQSKGLFGWFDRRTGLDGILRETLDEPIPGGARFAYVFGSGLIFIFLSQVITGVFLALYYVPSADHAHTTVSYITKAVSSGSFLRSIHAYGSSAMVILLLLHVTQTFLYGSYKGRRELLWLTRLRPLWSRALHGIHGLPFAVGSKSLFRHRRRNQHCRRNSFHWRLD